MEDALWRNLSPTRSDTIGGVVTPCVALDTTLMILDTIGELSTAGYATLCLAPAQTPSAPSETRDRGTAEVATRH